MFQEGQLIARAIKTPNPTGEGVNYDFRDVEFEVTKPNSKVVNETYKNVTRDGQRNRSATLLVLSIALSNFWAQLIFASL